MTYKHKIQYYETDKQGVTHHSNYVRIMEETRVDFMEQIGFGYERMEQTGVFSPVIGITCDYKHPTTFADVVEVEIKVIELKKLKVRFEYNMTHNGVLVCHATSLHCFLDGTGRPVVLEDRFPEFYQVLQQLAEQ